MKKKQKRSWGLYVLLTLGLLLFLLPFIYGAYNQSKQDKAQVIYNKQVQQEDQHALRQKVRAYNRHIFDQQQATGTANGVEEAQQILPQKGKRAIGYISVPAINLNPLMVYYGTSDTVLNKGIGNLDWSSMPLGGKNTMSILTGHSGLANQIYFDNIRHLKKGDVVYVTAFGKKQAYSVTNRIVIDPNDRSQYKKLNIKPGKDEIGLLTCTPIFINTDRLIVFAKRIPLKEAAKRHVEMRNLWSIDHLFMLFILIFLLLLALALWLNKRQRRKKRNDTTNSQQAG